MKNTILLFGLCFLVLTGLKSNNIAVSSVTLTDQSAIQNHVSVKFDLSWDNSWRSSVVPGNWDAAWVFIKYRISGGEWHHGTLDTTAGVHVVPAGAELKGTSDGKGVFIYRSSNGSGSNAWTNIKLRWKYGADGIPDDGALEVRVLAVEMVYIPGEAFYLGDGNGTNENTASFHPAATDNTSVQITNTLTRVRTDASANTLDNTVLTGVTGLGIKGGASGGLEYTGDAVIDNPYYPTGFEGFYIMKYEMSQDQYVDFLNSLTRTQQMARVASDISGTTILNTYVMNNAAIMVNFNSIRCDANVLPSPTPVIFYNDYDGDGIGNENADGMNKICNSLSWPDVAAYADWAGLRPMSELEFEKTCRGPNNALYQEYAWGTANLGLPPSGYTMTNTAMPGESLTGLITNAGNAIWYETYSGVYPARTGIFAASSANHTRQETGATYYGVMEMSGSAVEMTVHAGSLAGYTYRSNHGNGSLNTAGFADVDYWPGINGNSLSTVASTAYSGTGVSGTGGVLIRGGYYNVLASGLQTSYRPAYTGLNLLQRSHQNSGRLVRTAP